MKPLSHSASPAASEPTVVVRVDERGQLERALLALLPRVRMWLSRLLGPYGALDEATHACMVVLATELPRLEEGMSMEHFAQRAAVRVAYRYYGRASKAAARSGAQRASSTPEVNAIAEELTAKLHRCLAKLSPRRRTAFVLCAIEGLSFAQAAALEGTTERVIEQRYARARDDLAGVLGSFMADGATR